MKNKLIISAYVALAVISIGSFFALNQKERPESLVIEGESVGLRVLSVPQGGTGAATFATGECLVGNGTGAITTQACGSGAAFAWTPTSYGNATSTTLGFLNGFLSTASSTIDSNLIITGNSTTTAATTTNFAVTSLSSALIKVDGNGSFLEAVAGTDYENIITAGDGLTRTLNDIDCDTASGSVFGCLTSADWTTFNNKLSSYDAWTHPAAGKSATTSEIRISGGLLSTASTTIDSNLIITGNSTTTSATTTNFAISSLTSALLQTNGNGTLAEYAGTSCTNQFPRSLSALGVATCATVGAADVSLAELTTGTGLSSVGTYTGATARTFSVDQAFSPTWTGAHIFNNVTRSTTTAATTTNLFSTTASSTNLFASVFTFGNSILSLLADTITAGANAILDFGGASSLEIPNGTGPTTNAAGEIAVDTTSGQLRWYDGARQHQITGTSTKSFNLASTTMPVAGLGTGFKNGTSTFWLMTTPEAITATGAYCVASSTGTALIRFGDQSGNYTNTITADTGSTRNQYALTSNNTWTAGEDITVQASSTSEAVERIGCTFIFRLTAD